MNKTVQLTPNITAIFADASVPRNPYCYRWLDNLDCCGNFYPKCAGELSPLPGLFRIPNEPVYLCEAHLRKYQAEQAVKKSQESEK